MDMAPVSLLKLNSEKANGDMSKPKKKEVCAISFRYFGSLVKEANPKAVLLAGLEVLVSARPAILLEAAAAAATTLAVLAALAPAAPALAAPVPAAPALAALALATPALASPAAVAATAV